MEKKFYNSIQWGIQKKELNKVRSKGLGYLEEIGCKTNLHYSLTIEDVIKRKEKVDKVFSKGCTYLIIFEPNDKKLNRILEFDINTKEQLYELVSKKIKPEDWKEYIVSFIEQIKDNNKSFVGTAISDGKGKLFIEFLQNTTNSMQLTSTGANPKRIDTCYFSDFDTISIIPKNIHIEFVKKIKDSCHFFKGYYEFVYGNSMSNDDIFFTFYSDIKDYRNILDTTDELNFKEQISSRIIYNHLLNSQYIRK